MRPDTIAEIAALVHKARLRTEGAIEAESLPGGNPMAMRALQCLWHILAAAEFVVVELIDTCGIQSTSGPPPPARIAGRAKLP